MASDVVLAEGGGLSEAARIIDTFVAPGKTFADIRRKATWWGPFLLMVLLSIPFIYAVDKKVGFESVADKQMHANHFAADRIDALPPDQKAAVIAQSASRTRLVSYFSGVLILVFGLVISLLWWGTVNFAFGARTRYSQILAVWMYSVLPKSLMGLISAGLLMAGVGTDAFDMQNPLGTNPGYYFGADHPVLRAAGSFVDVFGIWSLILAILGISIVAGKTKGQAAIVVLSWWLLGLIVTTGMAAAFS